jgi:iron complex outermembrane receptor protein
VVITPQAGLSLTVDYYNIKVRNRIFISQPFDVTAGDIVAQPGLAAVGEGGNVSYFTNGLDTLTRGIDVVGTYRTDVGEGKLNLTLAYNYNKSTVSKYNTDVVSDAQIIGIEHLAPNHRANFSANYQLGAFTLNARESYYSWWRDEVDYPDQRFGAKFTTDLDVSYTFQDHFTLTVGANNVFNTKPDKIANSSSNIIYAATNSTADGQIYPRSGGPFGINGGFWYVRLRVAY